MKQEESTESVGWLSRRSSNHRVVRVLLPLYFPPFRPLVAASVVTPDCLSLDVCLSWCCRYGFLVSLTSFLFASFTESSATRPLPKEIAQGNAQGSAKIGKELWKKVRKRRKMW